MGDIERVCMIGQINTVSAPLQSPSLRSPDGWPPPATVQNIRSRVTSLRQPSKRFALLSTTTSDPTAIPGDLSRCTLYGMLERGLPQPPYAQN